MKGKDPVGAILASARDMTGTHAAILENLTTSVLLLDGRLRFSYANPAAEALFEVSAKQLLGQPLARYLPRARRLARLLRQALENAQPFTERGLEIRLPNRAITVDCTVSVLSLEEQRGRSEEGLLVEINHVDRWLRLSRDESILDRHAANRAVVRGLAHEIKNPLGGLRGAAQLLERALPDAALKEYTTIIIREADRLRALVERMTGPARALRKQPSNIHQIFEHVRGLILAEVPEGIVLVRDYDPSLPEFQADPDQLIQAVLNIARNAVQALNGRGVIRLRSRVERQMTVGQRRHRLVLRAEVEDDGPGIPEDIVEHIFYPLVTGRADGVGLGLSIAQAIANQHGGLIECASRPGRTVFTLYLPLE